MIYSYKCPDGTIFDVNHGMDETPEVLCDCGQPAKRYYGNITLRTKITPKERIDEKGNRVQRLISDETGEVIGKQVDDGDNYHVFMDNPPEPTVNPAIQEAASDAQASARRDARRTTV